MSDTTKAVETARGEVVDTARYYGASEVDRSEGYPHGTDLGDMEKALGAFESAARADERAAVIAEISDQLHDRGNLPRMEEQARYALQEASRVLIDDGEL